MKRKKCSRCRLYKNTNQFHKNICRSDGLANNCKKCSKKISHDSYLKYRTKRLNINKNWRDNNKNKCSILHKNWYINNRSKRLAQQKIYYECNKIKILKRGKLYRSTHKKQIQTYGIMWRKNNKNRIAKTRQTYRKNRKKYDPNFKLICNLRRRIHSILDGKSKSQSTIKLLGCSIEKFKIHLEQQFTKGMTWKNYGKWHIDHIIPLSSAKNQQQIEKLFHYSNCQPLWAKDNLKKHNKILQQNIRDPAGISYTMKSFQ